jgi:phosphohistidine phosphatase
VLITRHHAKPPAGTVNKLQSRPSVTLDRWQRNRYRDGRMARQIWLLRHGEAEPHGTRPDPERRLTERGIEQARNAGVVLASLSLDFAVTLTSPKVRAAETARLAAQAWGGEPEAHEPLSSGFDGRDALDALAAYGNDDEDARILVVGHEPDFSTTVAELTGARVDFKKGGIAAVRVAGGGGELITLLRPSELTRIAAAQPDPR